MNKTTMGLGAGLVVFALSCAAHAAEGPVANDSGESPADLFDMTVIDIPGVVSITGMRFLPDGRALLMDKSGQLNIRGTDGKIQQISPKFLVNPNNEQGLLGVAPHPDFETSKRIVVYWSRAGGPDGGTATDRHRVS